MTAPLFGFFDASAMALKDRARVLAMVAGGLTWQDAIAEINLPPHNIAAERQKLIGRGLPQDEFTTAARMIRVAGLTADEAVALAEKKRD